MQNAISFCFYIGGAALLSILISCSLMKRIKARQMSRRFLSLQAKIFVLYSLICFLFFMSVFSLQHISFMHL